MNRRFYVILVLLSVLAITQANAQFKIKGHLLNLPESEQLHLFSFFGQNLIKFDSTKSENGYFSFEFKKDIPRGFYRLSTDKQHSINLVLGSESVNIEGNYLDLNNSLSISESIENDLFSDFQAVNKVTYEGLSEIQKLKQSEVISLTDFEAMSDSITDLQKDYYKNITATKEGTFMAKVTKALGNAEKTNYWDNVDFNDVELTRGDMLMSLVFNYFRNHVPRDINSWLNEYKSLINQTTRGSAQRELVYMSLVQLFHSAAPTYAKEVAIAYNNEYPHSPYSLIILNALPAGPPGVGEFAPNIAMKTSQGDTKELSSLKGKVVLIDFWASWCGPCRRENPNVVKAYKEYRDKGFTIYGVSLDRSKEKWLAAIEKDGLDWHHVSDLQGWKSEGAATYKITGIPATFLVDKDGRIIGKNLRGKALHDKLKEVLN